MFVTGVNKSTSLVPVMNRVSSAQSLSRCLCKTSIVPLAPGLQDGLIASCFSTRMWNNALHCIYAAYVDCGNCLVLSNYVCVSCPELLHLVFREQRTLSGPSRRWSSNGELRLFTEWGVVFGPAAYLVILCKPHSIAVDTIKKVFRQTPSFW
jgi:hypothetical protein